MGNSNKFKLQNLSLKFMAELRQRNVQSADYEDDSNLTEFQAEHKIAREDVEVKDVGGLSSLNACAGALFALQCALHFYTSREHLITITTPKYYFDENSGKILTQLKPIYTLQANLLVSFYFSVPALTHLMLALVPPVRNHYQSLIMSGRGNPYRWLEYFFSATIMVVLCCLCVGIKDLSTLLLVGGAHSAMQIFGHLAERENGWASLIGGWFTFVMPWSLFLCFGLIHLVHFVGIVKNYYTIECIYVLLSFI